MGYEVRACGYQRGGGVDDKGGRVVLALAARCAIRLSRSDQVKEFLK